MEGRKYNHEVRLHNLVYGELLRLVGMVFLSGDQMKKIHHHYHSKSWSISQQLKKTWRTWCASQVFWRSFCSFMGTWFTCNQQEDHWYDSGYRTLIWLRYCWAWSERQYNETGWKICGQFGPCCPGALHGQNQCTSRKWRDFQRTIRMCIHIF